MIFFFFFFDYINIKKTFIHIYMTSAGAFLAVSLLTMKELNNSQTTNFRLFQSSRRQFYTAVSSPKG